MSTVRMTLVGLLASALVACGSLATTICELECDCEHCNDIKEELECTDREAEMEKADIYGCLDQWEAWASCVENNGECNEQKADWSTRGPGKCATGPVGMSCTTGADCAGYPGSTCDGTQCVSQQCADMGMPCDSDDDCPGGEDRCADEIKSYGECMDKATSLSGAGPW
ncbi:MAG: hypothetical protein HY744_23185 [Deltaproteobacteria bacterium]|nr:hypothetical protein [Deltaproteobacteria bacterium]